MRCTSKKIRQSFLCIMLCFCVFLGGCSWGAALEEPFAADHPDLGVLGQGEDADIPYFAKDLCVTSTDAAEIEANTEEALAACFFKLDSKEILYAKNVHQRLYPASTTKIMTALVALDEVDVEAQTTVSKEAVTFTERGVSKADLKEGDILTIRQLLYGLLLASGNDAANAIAEQVSGSNESFVELMNVKAQKIGATNTHFTNPHGLHDEEHYTTVYDLYLMFQEAMKHEEFIEILKAASYEASYLAADGTPVTKTWMSSDLFTKGDVTVPEGVVAVGGKTGTTSAAKSCLVQLFEDAESSSYVAIILGCEERGKLYEEMQSFLSSLNN